MSVDTSNVNWDLFAPEEQDAIKRLMKFNIREYLTGGVINMTPEKEAELQKIVDAMRPNNLLFKSKVVEQDEIRRIKEGLPSGPQTPDEEAALQGKLDQELAEFQAKEAHRSVEQAQRLQAVARFCNFCDSKGGRHKLNCTRLTQATTVAPTV